MAKITPKEMKIHLHPLVENLTDPEIFFPQVKQSLNRYNSLLIDLGNLSQTVGHSGWSSFLDQLLSSYQGDLEHSMGQKKVMCSGSFLILGKPRCTRLS
jgi:hypothetical protein